MVKFSAISCTILLWITVTIFLSISNHTEGKDHRVSKGHGEKNSSLVRKPAKSPGMTRRKRSATDSSPSIFQFRLKSPNDTNPEFESSESRSNSSLRKSMRNSNDTNLNSEEIPAERKEALGSFDLEKSTNGINNSLSIILKPLDLSQTVRNDFSFLDDGNKPSHNSQDQSSNGFATVLPTTENISSISNDSFTETRPMSSCGMNSSVLVNRTRGALTLANFEGPVILQDAESLEEAGSLTSPEHIRVKRESLDSRKPRESGKKEDEESNVKNELMDVYPDLIDDPVDSNAGVELIRKKRVNYEMLMPGSNLKSVNDGVQERSKELNDDRYSLDKNSDPEYIGSPVYSESFAKYDNSLPEFSLLKPAELSGSFLQLEREAEERNSRVNTPGVSNPVRNLTNVENRRSDFGERYPPIDDRSREISNSVVNEIGNSYSKRRKKRYAQEQKERTSRKGGGKKGRKSKHRKHKKKRKKPKKMGKKHKGRDVAAISGDPNFENERGLSRIVDEVQVEPHVEERDSGDTGSEIRITKREIPGDNEAQSNRGKRRIENEENPATKEKTDDIARPVDCKSEELRYYDDVYEPILRTQRDYMETKPDFVGESEKENAAKSVKQIKKLMEKLIDRVDELGTYVGTAEAEDFKKGKKRAEVDEDFSNSTKSVEGGVDSKNLTKDRSEQSRVCCEETDASKSKLDTEMSGRAGDEAKAKTAKSKTEGEKRSTRILSRRQTSRKRKIEKRKAHRKWDRWTDWSSCSVTCGKGRQIRWRHCVHDCITAETEMEEKACQLPACSPGKFLGIF